MSQASIVPQDLQTLVYVSRNRVHEHDVHDEISRIEATARHRNEANGITGVLLFSGCHYLQVLEGTADRLDELVDRLARDGRHSDIKIVIREPISHRRYSNWSMCYPGQTAYALTYFSRLHYGFSTGTDMTIIETMISRELA